MHQKFEYRWSNWATRRSNSNKPPPNQNKKETVASRFSCLRQLLFNSKFSSFPMKKAQNHCDCPFNDKHSQQQWNWNAGNDTAAVVFLVLCVANTFLWSTARTSAGWSVFGKLQTRDCSKELSHWCGDDRAVSKNKIPECEKTRSLHNCFSESRSPSDIRWWKMTMWWIGTNLIKSFEVGWCFLPNESCCTKLTPTPVRRGNCHSTTTLISAARNRQVILSVCTRVSKRNWFARVTRGRYVRAGCANAHAGSAD